jgi:hypothetical protein
VFRFQEMQSQNLTKSRSLDLTLDFPRPTSHSPGPSERELSSPVFLDDAAMVTCGLCEDKNPNRASWYCEQCAVSYCQRCLDNYHPKRGSLSHHRVRKATYCVTMGKPPFCDDHETELASIFCDQCKAVVCHLCVCDGVGKHSGHKILAQETAWKQMKVGEDV